MGLLFRLEKIRKKSTILLSFKGFCSCTRNKPYMSIYNETHNTHKHMLKVLFPLEKIRKKSPNLLTFRGLFL